MLSNAVVILVKQKLKTFSEPDTSKPPTGFIDKGAHGISEVKVLGNATYVKLKAKHQWACVEWNGVNYALLDLEPGIEDIKPGICIPEATLTKRLPQFQGFVYSRLEPKYLETPVPGHRYPIAPPRQNNCSVFAEDFVVGAFRSAHADLPWTLECHEMAMVANPGDLFSPPKAFVKAKMATASSKDPRTLPRPWSVCQGWRSETSGHTFLVLAVHAASRKVCILESNFTYGMNGPGMRGLGDLDKLMGGPPALWWTNPKVPTWEDVHNGYVMGIQRSSLHVTSPVWGRVETAE